MESTTFLQATALNLIINVCYTVIALIIGIVSFRLIDKFFFTGIDFVDEIKKGNIAASIFASTLFCFIAIVIGFALRG